MSLGSTHKHHHQEKRAPANSFRTARSMWLVFRPYVVAAACILILVAGAALRFQSINWDDGQHLHPDERFLTMVATGIQEPANVREYFDSQHSPLNPYNANFHSYVYGTFPLFLTKAVAGVLGMAEYDKLNLVGRTLSGVMDLISIVFVFMIGRKLYNSRVGLLASFLLTFTVFHIQQSHFFTVDMPANLMVVIAMYFAIQVARGGHWTNLLGLGIAFGLAVASKINLALFALVIGLACVERVIRPYLATLAARAPAPVTPLPTSDKKKGKKAAANRASQQQETAKETRESRVALSWQELLQIAWRIALPLALIFLLALVVFRVAQPYAFSGPRFFDVSPNPQWVEDLRSIGRLVSGEGDYPAGHQWAFRTPYLFPWVNMVQWGMGWGLGLTAWIGVGLAVWEMIARRKYEHLLIVVWIAATFFVQGGGFVLTMRYFLPIYPFLVLLAAYLLVWLWESARSHALVALSRRKQKGHFPANIRRSLPLVAAALIGLVMLSTVLWAAAFSAVYQQPVSRVTASRWIYANIPKGTAFAWEHWDDPLPLRVDGKDTAGYYTTIELPLYSEDTPEKLYGYAGQPESGLLDKLDKAEWIFISSARLYTSIPRLPMRYPMTTKYYQALFSGELGFERVKTFTNFPALGGWQINDQGAEEQFTVYDHPRVDLFRKTESYSRERAEQLLENVDWDAIQKLSARNASRGPGGLLMTAEERQVQQAGGTWSEMFNRSALANQSDLAAVILWLLAVELVSFAALPLTLLAFGGLADRGYALAKPLGLLLVSYLAWVAASITPLPFSRLTVILAVGIVGTAGGLIWALQPSVLGSFFQTHKRIIVIEEILFLVFLVAFVLVRRENPDLWRPWTGGEKPMDFAYLNAVLKSTHFPPYDPWFAGGYLNYYYFGYVQIASLIKLTGILPWIAYNLALPMLFAMTAAGAFSVVYNLVHTDHLPVVSRRAVWAGLFGALFVAVIGNLGEVRLIYQGLRELGALSNPDGAVNGFQNVLAGISAWRQGTELPIRLDWWYWNATRILPGNEIEEFPFFSFLFGDMHAHVMALPLALLALGAVVHLLRMPGSLRVVHDSQVERGQRLPFLSLGVLALVIGAMKPLNTWDYPTYILLGFLALAIWGYQDRQGMEFSAVWIGIIVFMLMLHFIFGLNPTASLALAIFVGGVYGLVAGRRAALAAGFLAFASLVFFLPFSNAYFTPYNSVELWRGARTSLVDYLTIHGLFLLVICTYLLLEWVDWWKSLPDRTWWLEGMRYQGLADRFISRAGLAWISVAMLILLAVLGFVWKLPVGVVALPFSLLSGLLLLRPSLEPARRFTLAMILAGLLLTLMVEVIVLKGDIGRSNTFFKFYLQVWILWGCAAASVLPWIWSGLIRRLRAARWVWGAGFAMLFVGAALYPLFATPAHLGDRMDPSIPATLNGMVFLQRGVYSEVDASGALVPVEMQYDHDALTWMQDNISGSPVIAEANHPNLYHWTGRVSIWTGLPSILGYNWHQKQQRAAVGGDNIDRREQQANRLFQTSDEAETVKLIRKFAVQYIYVGALERAFYPADGLEKFDKFTGKWLEVAYENPQVRIYRVNQALLPGQ